MYMTTQECKVSVDNFVEPPDQVMKNTMYNISGPEDGRPNASTGGKKETVKEKKVALVKDLLRERIFKLFEKAKGYTLDEVCQILI